MTALERAIARPQPVHDFAATSPLDGLERRSVGFADVLAQSVAAVAPTAAATTVILLVAGASGGGTVWAVAVATVLALLVARTVNQFANRLAATGSLYTYVARGLGAGAVRRDDPLVEMVSLSWLPRSSVRNVFRSKAAMMVSAQSSAVMPRLSSASSYCSRV